MHDGTVDFRKIVAIGEAQVCFALQISHGVSDIRQDTRYSCNILSWQIYVYLYIYIYPVSMFIVIVVCCFQKIKASL